jgi:ribosome-binding ATPase YchF (GTP1/OBG family)
VSVVVVEEVNLKDYNRLKKEYKSLKKRSQMLNDMLYTRNQEYETLKKSANTVDLERFARLSLQYLKEKGIIFFIFKTIKSLFILIVICVLTLIRTIKNDIKNSIINYFKIKKAKKE